jgi:hypothetical protein
MPVTEVILLLLFFVLPSYEYDFTAYWTTSQFSVARAWMSSTSALDLAIFAGGGTLS